MTTEIPLNVEGPYRHGAKYRCRIRTAEGRRWLPAADTIEGAIAEAQRAETAGAIVPDRESSARPLRVDPSPAQTLDPAIQGQRRKRREGAEPSAIRIVGPYSQDGGFRYRLVSSAGRTWASMARTEREALRLAEQLAATTAEQGGITIRDSLDAYLQTKRRVGVRPATLTGSRDALVAYFRGTLDMPVCRLTTRVGQAQYDKLLQAVDPRTGRQTAVATHRAYLSRTKGWARWVVAKGWLKGPSPLESVQGIGKRRRGKQQLSIDQTRQLIITCTDHATRGDAGGVATLMAVCMAMRASEILSRTVADIDDNGRVLRISSRDELGFHVKTDESARSPEIPPGLRPILAQLTAGKTPSDPLFPSSSRTGRRPRQWLNVEVARMCGLAGVPVICPHSLRGAYTTVAISRGVRLDLISDYVGHRNSTMTVEHYIAPGALQTAQLRQGLEVLTQSPPALAL